MKLGYIHDIILCFILILLQVVLFNRMSVFGMAIPLPFIYLLIKMPKDRNPYYVAAISFFMGIVIDIFSNTQGLNAASLIIISIIKNPIFNIFYSREELENFVPSLSNSPFRFMAYAGVIIILHHFFIFLLELFSFQYINFIAIYTVSSSVLTFILIIAFELLTAPSRRKIKR